MELLGRASRQRKQGRYIIARHPDTWIVLSSPNPCDPAATYYSHCRGSGGEGRRQQVAKVRVGIQNVFFGHPRRLLTNGLAVDVDVRTPPPLANSESVRVYGVYTIFLTSVLNGKTQNRGLLRVETTGRSKDGVQSGMFVICWH